MAAWPVTPRSCTAPPDGSKTLTAALNYVDDAALSLGAAFQQATQRLVAEVFGNEQTGPAQ
ncbi:hypothetical protein [Nonomuraea salmonea]|uniref:hypothetical protein n=1 Tax=Nonomuraea salmonea TaxID=46181 RepID=UPI002FE7866E